VAGSQLGGAPSADRPNRDPQLTRARRVASRHQQKPRRGAFAPRAPFPAGACI